MNWKALLLVLVATAATAATVEVLVGPTPVRIPRTGGSTGVLIQNMGADPICCAQGQDASIPNCVVLVGGGGNLSLDIPSNQPVSCVAGAQQVADAGTRVLEVY